MGLGLPPLPGTVAIVCTACSEVSRLAVAAAQHGAAWACPHCGALKPHPLRDATVAPAALPAMAAAPAKPAHSENFRPPPKPGAPAR